MNLSKKQQEQLARALSTILPDWDHRHGVAQRTNMGDVQFSGEALSGWRMLVQESARRNGIEALLRAALHRDPSHSGLQKMVAGIEQKIFWVPPSPLMWIVMLGGSLGLLILGIVLVIMGITGDEVSTLEVAGSNTELPTEVVDLQPKVNPPLSTEKLVPPPVVEENEADPALNTVQPTKKTPPAVDLDKQTIKAPPEVKEKPASMEVKVVKPSISGADLPNAGLGASATGWPCPGAQGVLVGYAYAGTSPPEINEGVWSIPEFKHVRREFPRFQNGYNTRTESMCVLPKGWNLRMDEAPMLIEGGAHWVLVYAGAILRPE